MNAQDTGATQPAAFWNLEDAVAGLMYTDVTLITEHHIIPFFTVWRPAHITDHIFIILYA